MDPNAPPSWKRIIGLGFGLCLLALAAMIGCSESTPYAPHSVGTLGTVSEIEARVASAVDAVEAPITGTIVEKSQRISALLGGSITAGRHTLVFPPGALAKDTVITLRDLTGVMGRVECEALPHGIRFRVPVLLTTRFSDLELVRGHGMYWIVGEGTPEEEWVPVGGMVSIGNLGLSVNLRHFSKYAPGKAGW